MPLIRLVIVDGSQFLRTGLRTAIEAGEDVEVVGEFGPTEETLSELVSLAPDVALLGMNWTGGDGLAVCREVRERLPDTSVVMVSPSETEEEMAASIIAGASGYISTDASWAGLMRVIHVAASGGTTFARVGTDRVLEKLREVMHGEGEPSPSALTNRERTVLSLLALGSTNEEIGHRLKIATTTVRNYITKIRDKLDLHSRTKLTGYAHRHGLVNGDGSDAADAEG